MRFFFHSEKKEFFNGEWQRGTHLNFPKTRKATSQGWHKRFDKVGGGDPRSLLPWV
jgi:hypothetical protein